MTAEEFLSAVAGSNLVPGEVVESLRRQVAKSAKPVAPPALAKLLTDKGHLTALQAQKLLGAAPPAQPHAQPGAQAAVAAPSKPAAPAPLAPLDDLGLLPLDDLLGPAPPAQPAAAPVAKPIAAPAKPAAAAAKSIATPVKAAAAPAPKAPAKPAAAIVAKPATAAPLVQPLDDLQPLDGLETLDAAPLDALGGDDLFGPAPAAPARPGSAAIAVATADPFAPAVVAPAGPAGASAAAAAVARPASGGGAWKIIATLVVLVAIAGALATAFFFVPRDNGDEAFAAAEQDYQAKQYAAALEKFATALERHPRHAQASLARVHQGMARLLTASSSPTDWSAILPVAKESIAPLAAEPELKQVHSQLAPLLMDMADGLTELARKEKNADQVAARIAQAKEALALTDDARLLPGDLREWQRLAATRESLATIEYEAGRGPAISAALAAIKQAAAAGQLDATYAERQKLLLAYPDLATSADVRGAGQEIAAAALSQVTSAADTSAVETTESNPAIVASTAFFTPLAVPASAAPGKPFVAQGAGAAYALDGGTGKLLWRRASAGDSRFAVPLTVDAAQDAILVTADGQGIERVAASSGKLVWRRNWESTVVGVPITLGGQVALATRGGKVALCDAAGGQAHTAQLPQSLSTGPAAGSGHLYQLADHSQLFVLASADLQCEKAIYLGHEPGSVLVPPVVLARSLVIADNRGAATATLHVIGLDDEGLPGGVLDRLVVPGHVLTPPVVLGERLIVLTDRGTTDVFRITSSKTNPLERIADSSPVAGEPRARFGSASGDRLLIAGQGLRLGTVDSAGGTVQEVWAAFPGDEFLGPAQQAGDAVFSLRHEPGRPGLVAAAVQTSTGTPLWQTRIALPLITGSNASTGNEAAIAISTLGGGSVLDAANLNGVSVVELPALYPGQPPLPRIASRLALPGGETALVPAGNAGELWMLSADLKSARPMTLPGPLAGPPILWQGGLLVACSSGDINWIDPATGALRADPLLLPIEPGQRLAGCSLAAAGDSQAVLSAGGKTLRLLGLESQPQPHLVELKTVTLPAPAISAVATLDSHAFVVDAAGELRSFALPDFAPGPSWKLAAAGVLLGPVISGNRLFVATDQGELWCFGSEQNQLWKAPLPHGSLAGAPLELGGSLWVATRGGSLCRLDPASGQEQARISLHQSLAGPPIALGQSLLVPAADGTLLKVALPTTEAASP